MNHFHRDPRLGWAIAASLALLIARPAPAFAQSTPDAPAVADSLVRAPADSVDALAPLDTLELAPVDTSGIAPVDSLGGAATPDSLRTATGDSLRGSDAASDEAEDFVLLDRIERLRRLQPGIVGPSLMDWVRPETLEPAIELLPSSSIRVAGDVPMPAYLALSPVGTRAPEIWSDGIPTRSPGDLDPGFQDRSQIGVEAIGSSVDVHGPDAGAPHVWLRRRAPQAGRTLLYSRFSTGAFESFHRGVSITTPATDRVVRLDFEDWKTDEGYAYSLAPNVVSSSSRGRAAQRRFRLGTDLQIGDARVRFTFGRGRRYHRGDVLGAEAWERWTGEAGLVVDHFSSRHVDTFAAWHLDFHDDERVFSQEIDAARQGLRWRRRPDGAGVGADLTVERWSMRTATADTVVRVDPSRVVRAAVTAQGDPDATWWPWLRLEVADTEHGSGELGFGGRTGLRVGSQVWAFTAFAARDLRTPTLLESAGWKRFRTLTPAGDDISYVALDREWRGTRRLDFEREERAGVQIDGQVLGFDLLAVLEQWRLRDGIGWTADGDVARVVGDRELDALQTRWRVGRAWSFGSASSDWRLRTWAQGHFVIDEAEVDASRGVGWPRWQTRARAGIGRSFFSTRNRIGVDVDVDGRGTARDDALGPLGAVEIPVSWDLSARAWLKVRDAEMSINVDNVLDRRIDEVAGTSRRPRQIRWQLVWPFFN